MAPTPAVQQTGKKTAPTSSQETPPPPTEQQTSNNTGTSAADRLLSSLGACAVGKAEETTQPSIKATPPEREPEKASSEPIKVTKPVVNITGQAKTTGTGDNNTKKAAHPSHKSAKLKARPEDKPQIGAGKPEKVIAKPHGMSDTAKSDRETGSWDADDVLIVHDGTKHAHSEPTQPG